MQDKLTSVNILSHRYETLILIGGGIGVTPLLAIIHDIMHRKGEINIPTSIKLYYCVRKQEELSILKILKRTDEYKTPNGQLDLHIFTYITSLQEYIYDDDTTTEQTTNPQMMVREHEVVSPNLELSLLSSQPHLKPQGPFHIGAKGKSPWVALTIFASIVGFYVLWGTTNTVLVKGAHSLFPNYHRSHFIITSMISGIIIFGGPIVMLWWLCGISLGAKSNIVTNYSKLHNFDEEKFDQYVDHPWRESHQLGSRPEWNGKRNCFIIIPGKQPEYTKIYLKI